MSLFPDLFLLSAMAASPFDSFFSISAFLVVVETEDVEGSKTGVISDSTYTVKPALSDHLSVQLKMVFQNRWSLNGGSLFGTDVTVYLYV